MKLDQLEVGKIYECNLSARKVLVCEVDKELPTGNKVASGQAKGQPEMEFKKVKVGKSFVTLNSGDMGFAHDELFDGQLKEI